MGVRVTTCGGQTFGYTRDYDFPRQLRPSKALCGNKKRFPGNIHLMFLNWNEDSYELKMIDLNSGPWIFEFWKMALGCVYAVPNCHSDKGFLFHFGPELAPLTGCLGLV